jgi:hypothetical protein
MPKALIKVYFNNGCTTLAYNDTTTVEDIIKIVIKGKLSLNELRFKQCFKLRSTKFTEPFKDFDPGFLLNSNGSGQSSDANGSSVLTSALYASTLINSKIEDFFWLRNDTTIKEWLQMIGYSAENPAAVDYWK